VDAGTAGRSSLQNRDRGPEVYEASGVRNGPRDSATEITRIGAAQTSCCNERTGRDRPVRFGFSALSPPVFFTSLLL